MVCNLKFCQIYTKTVIALTKFCIRMNLSVYVCFIYFFYLFFFCFVFHTKFCPYGILATKNEAIVCEVQPLTDKRISSEKLAKYIQLMWTRFLRSRSSIKFLLYDKSRGDPVSISPRIFKVVLEALQFYIFFFFSFFCRFDCKFISIRKLRHTNSQYVN